MTDARSMPSEDLVVHVRCSPVGRWRVELGLHPDRPVSEHDSETAAEAAARDRFGGRAGELLLHDRYDRTRSVDLAALGD